MENANPQGDGGSQPDGKGMPRVVVVGGSVGGLTAALKLQDIGCNVDLYERSEADLQARGAGIIAHPVTLRYFAEHKVLDLDQISILSNRHVYLNRDGTTAYEERVNYRFTAWNTVYRALRGCLESQRYHPGETMVGFEQDWNRVLVHFASGRVEEADLLVCADGVASTGRSLLLPDAKPVYAGYVGWRGTVPELSLSPPTLEQLRASIVYHLMPNGHVLAYPIPSLEGSTEAGHRLINLVWYRNVPAGPVFEELMTDRFGMTHELSVPPGAVQDRFVEELRRAALELPSLLQEVVLKCETPFIQPIVDIEVPRMVFGRICLIGDAAFAIRPHAAAGTAKACADGWALADAIREAGADTIRALEQWEPVQLQLGRQLIARVRDVGDRSQFHGTWRPGDPWLRFGLWEPGDAREDGLTEAGSVRTEAG